MNPIIGNSISTTHGIGLFFNRSTKNRLEKSVIYGSMRLHPLFPMVKIAVLYLVAIKRYSKNTYEHSCSCYQHTCERRSIDREKNNFFKSIYKKKKNLAHYFWITLSSIVYYTNSEIFLLVQ